MFDVILINVDVFDIVLFVSLIAYVYVHGEAVQFGKKYGKSLLNLASK